MSSVIEFLAFKQRRDVPTLVLVDLHREAAGKDGAAHAETPAIARALANCRAALRHARAQNMSVAFIRRVERSASLLDTRAYPSWLAGFEPGRMDMVFDRRLPSCYTSVEFVDMANYVDGNYVLAGLFGETSCLSTAVDAFHRNHRLTFLTDASASRGFEDVPADSMHDSVTAIISLYGTVATTQSWIRATSQALGESQ